MSDPQPIPETETPPEPGIDWGDDSLPTTPPPLPPPAAPKAAEPNFFRYLYNSNPFYALSAALVLFGFREFCIDPAAGADPFSVSLGSWTLFGLLVGYTLLLAGTGVFIVRRGAVWDDARTILVSIVLLLMALAVGFDHLLLTQPSSAMAILGAGALFSAATIEGALRGARIRLPVGFRLPLHAVLASFFLYPLSTLAVLESLGYRYNALARTTLEWLVFAFPTVVALCAALLLPAARRGPSLTADSGTPWRWPYYPWSVFVLLAVGAVFRAYYLSITFDPRPGFQTAFGAYFLTPLVLVATTLWFECGRSVGNRGVQAAALWTALLWLPATLEVVTGKHAFHAFMQDYKAIFGAPLFATALGLAGVYLYAWRRGVQAAELGVWGLLAFAAHVANNPNPPTALTATADPKIAGVGFALALLAVVWRPHATLSWAGVLGFVGLLAGAYFPRGVATFPDLPLHALAVATMTAGWLGRDRAAPVAVGLAGPTLFLIGYRAAARDGFLGDGLETRAVHLGALLAVLVAYTAATRKRSEGALASNATFAVFLGLLWLGHVGVLAIRWLLKLRNWKAILLVVGGAASFVVAFAISWRKARLREVAVGERVG